MIARMAAPCLLGVLGVQTATFAAPPEPTPRAQLDAGDIAWCAGHRAKGVRAWRRAVRLANGTTPEHASVSISARARLIQAGSNWTPLIRGGGLNRALASCPPNEPRCQQAYIDFHAFVPAWMGSDPARGIAGATELLSDLPGPAAARLHLLDAADAPALQDAGPLDGLGRCLLDGPFPRTGTSVIGVGVMADRGAGLGLGLRLIQPDGLRTRLSVALDGFVATHGAGASLSLDPPQADAWIMRASAIRTRWWTGLSMSSTLQGALMIGPRLRREHLLLYAGPTLRWDGQLLPSDDTVQSRAGHGAEGSLILDYTKRPDGLLRGWRLTLIADGAHHAIADYDRAAGLVDLRMYHPIGPIEGAARLRSQATAWFDQQPIARRPSVGGPYVHRGAPMGQHQGPWTATVDLEGRAPVWGPVWLAAFTDLATVADEGFYGGGGVAVHPGAGVGVRLKVPPAPHNTLRLDLGFSDSGYQLQVGWGEAI